MSGSGPRPWALALAALGTVGVGFVIGYVVTGSGHESRSVVGTAAPSADGAEPVGAAPSAGTPAADPSARPRTAIPRPAPAAAPAPPAPPPTGEDPPEDDAPLEPPAPSAPVPAAQMPAALQAVVEEQVKDEIAACLESWAAVEPGLGGRVLLEFELGPTGLQGVSILDHSAVPMGPLSCFASAIWEARWPAPEGGGSLTVTYPFVFDMGDDAEAPG